MLFFPLLRAYPPVSLCLQAKLTVPKVSELHLKPEMVTCYLLIKENASHRNIKLFFSSKLVYTVNIFNGNCA
jgi:hypothetical protein